jgi:hypothetical protein
LQVTGSDYGDIIGLNQNIHHDDFEYSVSNYIVARFLKAGNDTLKVRGSTLMGDVFDRAKFRKTRIKLF